MELYIEEQEETQRLREKVSFCHKVQFYFAIRQPNQLFLLY